MMHVTVKQEMDEGDVKTGECCHLNKDERDVNNVTDWNCVETKSGVTFVEGEISCRNTMVKIESDNQTEVKLENVVHVVTYNTPSHDVSSTSKSLLSNEGRNLIEVEDCSSMKMTENETTTKTTHSRERDKHVQAEIVILEDKHAPDEADAHCLGGKKYKCKVCNKLFVKKSNIRSHELTHTGETPYKCQICHKGFNVRSNLNVHLRIHTGQRPHECDICKKTFRQAGQLKTHERIHKGEKPYQCNICSRSFRSNSSQITHLRTHTGEKPFICDICSRSFSTSTSLKTHRVTHSGTMLYDCPVCGRQFNRRNNLNVHIKRHNKNRKFSCPMCSNGFVMRAHLLSHLKRWHNVNANSDELKPETLTDVHMIQAKNSEETSEDLCENVDLRTKVKAENKCFEVKNEYPELLSNHKNENK